MRPYVADDHLARGAGCVVVDATERPRREAATSLRGLSRLIGAAPPVPVPARLREEIKEAYAHSDALLEEERFAQAAEVFGEVIEPAALALGSESKQVLALRRQRAAIRLLGGDYRAALPEFDALTDAYTRIAGPTSEQARAQAARCRAELGQVTGALAALQAVLNVVRAVGSDVSEEAVELRHNIGMQLPAQGRTAEARQVLEPLRQDLVHGVRPRGRDDRRDRRGARRDPPRPRRFGFLTRFLQKQHRQNRAAPRPRVSRRSRRRTVQRSPVSPPG